MKIMIDIDDEISQGIIEGNGDEPRNIVRSFQATVADAIKNGKPLPKGHGRIVDIGKIDKDKIESNNPIIYLTIGGECIEAVSLDYLYDLPTIIEADKVESEW